jgi:hypothetical protein
MDRLGVIPTTSDSQIVETHLLSTEATGQFREAPPHPRFRLFFAVGLACVLLVAELPFVLTIVRTGWSPLPPVVDYPADQMLYLNFTVIQHSSPREVVNPWYGERVSVADVPHLKFPITFWLFDSLRHVFHSWTATMLVWTGIWALLTFAAAVFCVQSIIPEIDRHWPLILAFALIVLRSPLTYISALTHLPSWRTFLDLTLPYERFAFPQVALFALLAYFGLLAKALRAPRWTMLAGMALLQFYCCAAFPYLVPIMALATLVAITIAVIQSTKLPFSLTQIVAFGVVCAALDGLYLFSTGAGHSGGNLQLSLGFHPEQIVPSFRPYVALLFALAAFATLAHIPVPGKATVAGFAVASGLLAFANVVFPQESLMLIHFNYVNALPMWLALFVVAWPLVANRSRHWAPAIVGALVVIALLEGYANYLRSLDFNELQGAAVAEVKQLGLTSVDTVVAPANMSDDISCWIPLLSPAKVVFTRDAENMLPPDRIQGEQALRQAFYLQLTGVTYDSFSALTEPGSSRPIPGSFVLFGEDAYLGSPVSADRAYGRALVRERLLPALGRLRGDSEIGQFLFFGAKRVFVIDDDRKPNFVRSVLAKWIDITSETDENGIRIIMGRPKAAHS